MEKIELDDFAQELPDKMPVSVIMEKRPCDHAWADYSYQAVGVVTSDRLQDRQSRKIHQKDGIEQYLYTGLTVQLYQDECESYYHNLMSPQPGCYVVAGEPEDDTEVPEPYLVSLSFDEVHAYLEGDEQVYAVEIPPELYKWTEAFVLTHYIAIKKTKRKLKNWTDQPQEKTQ
ncbi:MAG: DUF3305 domain-containing protein [Gammaproteobacteria bacterium]|nr:DUF3305 domain-containing protein [Gammaproteobacteria bacterium]